jgi:Uma2 family endonuclease
MPVAFLETIVPPAPQSPPRKRWTRAECELFDSLGYWGHQHLELIDGELIDKMGKNRPHGLALLLLQEWLVSTFGFLRVHKEEPIDVSPEDNPANEPEPDLVVLRESSLKYENNPQPEDVLLAVEVADSTLSFDLGKKAPLYARAGIPEYWILDVNGRRLIVHRDPAGGKYASVIVYHEHESVAPLAAPGSMFRVADAFRR